jgi:hypothetical protein
MGYELVQLGPYMTTGLDYRLRLLPTFTTAIPDAQDLWLPPQLAQVTGGNNVVLDNTSFCGATSFPISSSDPCAKLSAPIPDFAGLPLAGDYLLQILPAYLDGEQDLSRLEWVQLMIEPIWWSSNPPVSQ